MVIGYTNEVSEGNISAENYDSYHVSEIHEHKKDGFVDYNNEQSNEYSYVFEIDEPFFPLATGDGPIDSPWPMYCHDVRHTGRSPYSTIDNLGHEKWRFGTKWEAEGCPVIDNDGIIYIGTYEFYAVYPNGTLKWKNDDKYVIRSAAAIDENGVFYVGSSFGSYGLYAINPDGTTKWRFPCGDIYSSPAIGDDGTIYFGSEDHNIYALNPDKTLKWKVTTGHVVYSSPAIGLDGTVYCGSHDTYLYALYPNNGTLKWKYKTGHWVRVSPCIADDGTIYVVSLDDYLHAVYPNGTLKWKTDVGAGTSPTIGQDGTIYCGFSKLYAINPTNGSVKWKFNLGTDRRIRGGTPCNSIDGTIYFGTHIDPYYGGELIAVNSDGTEKWRIMIATDWIESAPAIGKDGTIYVGSVNENFVGFLHAIGIGSLEADANGPYYELINQPVQFTGSATGGHTPYDWHWDFGDTHTSEEQNPLHTYTSSGNYTVTLTVTDDSGNTSDDTTYAWIQTSNTPPNKPTINGPTTGNTWTSYPYTVTATDPEGAIIWYFIDWGDETNTGWFGSYDSGTGITKSHTWSEEGTYTIRCKAKDPYDAEGPEGTLTVTMPRNRAPFNRPFLNLLQQYSHKFPILWHILGL